MTSTERYKKDPNYRQRVLDAAKKHHEECIKYKCYRDLIYTRKSISNFKASITFHCDEIRRYQNRINHAIRRKEELEIEWGMTRARLKRQKSENLQVEQQAQSNQDSV